MKELSCQILYSNALFLDFLFWCPISSGMATKKRKLTVQDKLEMAEAICTIVVTIMALWGTISALNHSLFSKMAHLIEHYHKEVVLCEEKKG